MTRLQEELLRACNELGIEIELDYVLSLNEDKKVRTIAYIPCFGGPKGMLIVNSTKEIHPVWDGFLKGNYGFSVLYEPSERSEFDLDSFKEMFKDWGWEGDKLKG